MRPAPAERAFYDVAEPTSRNYGKFLTIEEINQLVGAPADAQRSVMHLLSRFGAYNVKSLGDAVTATARVADVEHLFSTEMYSFEHQEAPPPNSRDPKPPPAIVPPCPRLYLSSPFAFNRPPSAPTEMGSQASPAVWSVLHPQRARLGRRLCDRHLRFSDAAR